MSMVMNFLRLILCCLELSASNSIVVEICNNDPLIRASVQVLDCSSKSSILPNTAPKGDIAAKIVIAIQTVFLLKLAIVSKLISANAAGILCNIMAQRKWLRLPWS